MSEGAKPWGMSEHAEWMREGENMERGWMMNDVVRNVHLKSDE